MLNLLNCILPMKRFYPALWIDCTESFVIYLHRCFPLLRVNRLSRQKIQHRHSYVVADR